MKTVLTEEELMLIKGLLLGVMQENNRMLDKGYYITDEQKEVFEIAKELLGKVAEE